MNSRQKISRFILLSTALGIVLILGALFAIGWNVPMWITGLGYILAAGICMPLLIIYYGVDLDPAYVKATQPVTEIGQDQEDQEVTDEQPVSN